MKAQRISILSTGFAIFSMFFGAGNLIYPLQVGMTAGTSSLFGMIGFLLTAVLLPFAGLFAMILFDGNYESFFNRLGKPLGQIVLCASLLVIGPIIAIPRIVTLSHTMIAPFIPFSALQNINPTSSFIFAILFLSITFFATYRPTKIVDIIGNVISPLLMISLSIIIIKGLMTAEHAVAATVTPWNSFTTNFIRGYETLDLLGAIFFGAIIVSMLKRKINGENQLKKLTIACLRAGTIGVTMLSIIYVGMNVLGVFHGHDTTSMNSGQLFSNISFIIMGPYGAAIIATAVLMACLSTAIALSASVAGFLQKRVFNNKITFLVALLITLVASIPLSIYGLSAVLALTSGPLVYIGYPVIIALTFCNILYKTINFKPVTIPVALTFVAALVSYIW